MSSVKSLKMTASITKLLNKYLANQPGKQKNEKFLLSMTKS